MTFEQRLAAERSSVLRFVRRLTRDDVEADDVLQETLLDAVTHQATFRGEGSLKAWLFGIARNRVRHAHRGGRAKEEASDDEALETLGLKAGWGAPVDPEALTAQLEERAVLEAALAALPAEAREVLTLRELEGLSGEETAAVLGLSLAAMKSRLHRARLELVAQVTQRVRPAERARQTP